MLCAPRMHPDGYADVTGPCTGANRLGLQPLCVVCESVGKNFFVKKSKRLFDIVLSLSAVVRQGAKVFWFFFSKKNIPTLSSPQPDSAKSVAPDVEMRACDRPLTQDRNPQARLVRAPGWHMLQAIRRRRASSRCVESSLISHFPTHPSKFCAGTDAAPSARYASSDMWTESRVVFPAP